jgi:hypothetical protein
MNRIPEIVVRSEHDHSSPRNSERKEHLFSSFTPDTDLKKLFPLRNKEIPEDEEIDN